MTMLSRRGFLQDTALFAAAAAVFADEPVWSEEVRSVKKVGANDRIHVACIGFHGQGRTHLRNFSALPDSIVTTICDVDSNLADAGIRLIESRQKTAPKYVQDLRRIMDDKSIDAVSIATPNHWHALAAIWAIQAGKDVYVEKPVSHNVSEGRRIVDFARRHGRIVQTGTQSRSNEGMRQAIDFLHAGKLGPIHLARGICYKRRGSIGPKTTTPVPKGVDYNLWLGPAPYKPITRRRFHYDWHWFWDYGNGDLGNQGIHEMDKARWGLNRHTLCNAVFSAGGRFGYKDAGETANTQICFFDYGDYQLVFEVRGLQKKCRDPFHKVMKPGNWIGNIWYGTEGYMVSNSYSSAAAFTPKGELIQKFNGGGNHYANFLKAVRSRKHTDLHADIEDGHLSSALCHLGNISYRLGRLVPFTSKLDLPGKEPAESFSRMVDHLRENGVAIEKTPVRLGPRLAFDPTRERFVDNAEADKLLTRDYRKGFVLPAKA